MARHSRRVAEIGFDAITIEGALIATEMVAEVAATPSNAKAAADYGCPKGTALGDEIARYFRIGQAHWQAFARIEQPTVTQTAAFARGLLRDAFGFSDLEGPIEHSDGSRRYRIALEAKEGRVPVVCAAPVPEGDGFAKALPEFGDGEGGRARRSPVVLLQDWLNANPDFYWGLVFAGDRVRLMRDNASLTRAAWIEADLGAIFRDEMFADFTAWWLLTHASRFGAAGTPASDCALERWREAGLKKGTVARERLREGVEAALQELGQGLVEANPDLWDRIASGAMPLQGLFEELLRTVYRLIFLAVAEDRDLLHPRATGRAARDLYAGNYSFSFWRERSARRTAYDAHNDGWEGMKVTLAALEHGQPLLGLSALGGLFGRDGAPTLDRSAIPNRRFLTAIHRLGWIRADGVLHRINWRDMKTEELGSVYESLLEIRPILRPNGTFELDSGAKGNQRKTSGSYYTPDSLVETLLDSALDPVLDWAEANAETPEAKAAAILDLKVIDPACGSGHFLLGAARRMAGRIAALRNPDAPDEQAALRDVVSRCIHGVDRNPMAVELAKVALWIESVSPGQPLGFLDANIRCGDALLGVFDLEALERGVPDDAYKPLTGDSKDAAKYYKAKNKDEKKGQGSFDFETGAGAMPPKKLAANLATIRRMPEGTVGQVEKKREAFEAWRRDPARWNTKVACDLYTAAFLLPKTAVPENYQRGTVPTTADVWKKLGGGSLYGPLEAAALDGAEAARAFHWPLAFPDVLIGKGGFDVVLGNPPWERIKLQEQEFFAGHAIADEPNAAARTRAIARLAEAPGSSPDRLLYDAFQIAKRIAEATSAFARVPGDERGRFRYTGTGDVNTYALFAEHFLSLAGVMGRAGIIVPTGIATDATTAPFFGSLISSSRLGMLYSFENEELLFPGVHHAMKFSLLIYKEPSPAPSKFVFFARKVEDLGDQRRQFSLSTSEIARINPNTHTAPVFRSGEDARLAAAIYNHVPVLLNEGITSGGNPWGISFLRMFDMANDSHLFRSREDFRDDDWVREGTRWACKRDSDSPNDVASDAYMPLYEAKMGSFFDHRAASYASREDERGFRVLPETSVADHQNPEFEVEPFYWVEKRHVDRRLADKGWERSWLMGWKEIAASTNFRTLVPLAFPAWGVSNKVLLFFTKSPVDLQAALYANLNCLIADWVVRQKISGLSLSYFIIRQIPILPPQAYAEADLGFIVPRVLELSYTSYSMASFASDLGYEGPPFPWDEGRRAQLRAELDAWYALAYGLGRDELRYVLDPKDVMGDDYPSETFRVLQKNEIAKYGEYRTRRLVLAAYDKLVGEGMRPRTEGYR
ncbi:MAG: Eco57I restriction-modification methylase domain-containing protein [Allosphingosinicella sp.]|uniref:Eco57I restriction-modification methylase domain-containing protein n=1 Tax=Allosphingosinicella sp. TaxID=2823234 RepID=UPI00394AFCE4